MKKHYSLLLLLLIISLCSCSTLQKKMSFSCFDNDNGKKLNAFYSLRANIPKSYKCETYDPSGCDKVYHFHYGDSALLYFTYGDFGGNFDNIKNLGDSIHDFRFNYGELFKKINRQKGHVLHSPELPDTFELSGVNANGLYWKDIYLNGITVGYENIPVNQKEAFDKCLKSIKMKIRKKQRQ